MSRVLEAEPTAPSDIAFGETKPCNPYAPILQMQEAGAHVITGVLSLAETIATQRMRELETIDELLGTAGELQIFESLKYSDPDLYFATPQTQGSKTIIMANGFTPYNLMTENIFTAPLMKFQQEMVPSLKPNAMLEPKRKWYERHGHKATFAFDGPNHIWYENFVDTYNAAIQALNTGAEVWIDGLSGGGMLGEMVLKKLAKVGAVAHLITNGSPEVNEQVLELFEESEEREGMMGQVHKLAKMSAQMDPDKEKMAAEIYEATQSEFHPESRIVRFYSNDDRVCPPPSDPNAIEVGGKHAVIPYRKGTLRTLQTLLADENALKLAA